MKKSMATQKNSSIFGSGVNVGLAGKEINEKRMKKLFKGDPPSDKNLGLSAARVAGTKVGSMAKQGVRMNYEDEHRTYDYRGTYGHLKKDKAKEKKTTEKASQTPGGQAGTKVGSIAKQMAPIDPRTGMPIQPQMTPQPNTVGMPGSMPMPDGMGHTLPEHGMQAGGRNMSPYMQKKKNIIPGQEISESGHVINNMKDGPREGDLIRGPHLKYDNVGLPQDLDYKIKFQKDTVDQHGPYKIYKTTGIK